jgi:ribonuclease HI
LTHPLYRARTDGASRGNPGPAAIGVSLEDETGCEIATHSEAIGRATNNVAEYTAVIRALEMLAERGARRVELLLDSELIVRQLQGSYRVKSPNMEPLHAAARRLLARYDQVVIRHVPRAENRRADALANQALDRAAAGPGA